VKKRAVFFRCECGDTGIYAVTAKLLVSMDCIWCGKAMKRTGTGEVTRKSEKSTIRG